MTEPRSQSEFYDLYQEEVISRQPELTDWVEGSINDIQAGGASILAQELQRIMLDEFNRTYFSGADGDDLEFLATDHFGDDFAKPDASKAVGIVKFSRPTAGAGNVLIPSGTIVKTDPDANGQVQRFETTFSVTMTGLSINATIRAMIGGPDGNQEIGSVKNIESALTDPTITVTNEDETSGGEAEPTDEQYRQIILDLIQKLKGATLAAIQATVESVPGIVTATVLEFIQRVIEWDEGTSAPIGESFLIPHTKCYVADANGEANNALVQNVLDALIEVRAAGVKISVIGATAAPLNWTGSITLNPAGPNYAELLTDPSPIVDDMTKYVQDLAIGGGFNRALAKLYIMAIWGPAGTSDITNFTTTTPSGDIASATGVKLIPGTIEIV